MIVEARGVWLKDGEKLILRSPKVTEADALLVYLRATFREAYRNMNQPADYFDTFPTEKEATILAEFEKSDSQIYLCAFDAEERVVGALTCGPIGGGFVRQNGNLGMSIALPYRGRGLGNLMLQTLKFEAPKLGFHRLELTVRTFNQSGIALYEKCGFKRVGHLHDVALIDGEYFDEYQYELILG